jgi:hypothetical protein
MAEKLKHFDLTALRYGMPQLAGVWFAPGF